MTFRAEGSSYLIRQVAGSEKIGGLTVTVHPRSDSNGKLEICLSDWRTDKLLDYPVDKKPYADAAEQGVRSIGKELGVELSQFDIKLHRFIYHDVDSRESVYLQAGRSAFKSALEALRTSDM